MKHSFRTALLLSGLWLAASTAQADWIETFDGAYDNTWLTITDNGSTNYAVDLSNGYWHGTATGDFPNTFPMPFGQGPGAIISFVPGDIFTDVEVSGYVNLAPQATPGKVGPVTGNNGHGLVLRGGNNAGYMLSASMGWGSLQLMKLDGATNPTLTETPNGQFSSSDTMFLVFRAVGDMLEGWAYQDETRSGAPIAHVSVTDSSYSSGFSGVLAWFVDSRSDATVINATFDTVSSIAVPEPGTAMMAMVGFAALAGLRRRCR